MCKECDEKDALDSKKANLMLMSCVKVIEGEGMNAHFVVIGNGDSVVSYVKGKHDDILDIFKKIFEDECIRHVAVQALK